MTIERSIANIHLKNDQLLSLVQQAFPDCSQLENHKILTGGAQNTIYKFQIGEEEFILRIYARSRSHCKTEKELHALIDPFIPTAQLVYSNENHEKWPYAIFKFVPGSHLYDVPQQCQSALSFELGRVLALIHSFQFSEAGLFDDGLKIAHSFPLGSSPYFEEACAVLSDTKGYTRKYLGEKLADQTLSFMLQHQAFFPKIGKTSCLTHSDFKPVNLLYNQNGQVIVLDWEFAHAGIGILDFAILLRHRNQFPLDLAILEEGYVSHGGCLMNDWPHSAMITDFVNIITMMNRPVERPKLFEELKQALQTTMHQWNEIDLLFN